MTPQSISGADFGVSVLGAAIGGFGKYESGQQQKSADDYNADITLTNMRAEMAANTQKFSALVGTQAGRYAASGVDITSGSPLLIMAATAARGAQEGEEIEQAGTEQAAMERYYGKIAAFQGTMGGIGSFLSGVTSPAAAYAKGTFAPTPSVGS
jgi:hypothetical protein